MELKNIDIQAMLFGYIMGDGWLSINGVRRNIGASGSYDGLVRIKKDLTTLYGDIGKATIFTEETYSEKYNIAGITNKCTFNTKVADTFKSLGMPVGKRTEIETHIPQWILNGHNITKISFLSGYYAADGVNANVQVNRKTQRCLELYFHKREYLKDNAQEFCNEIMKILNDLGITATYSTTRVKTKDWSIRYVISFDNNLQNMIKALSILDLRYCPEKEKSIVNMLYYMLYKQSFIDRFAKVKQHCEYNRINNIKQKNKDIAALYGVTENKVKKIKTGANIGFNAKNILSFDDFVTILSALNPVKQGKLSDMYALISDLSCAK